MAQEAKDQLPRKSSLGPESAPSNTLLGPEPEGSSSGRQPDTREAVGAQSAACSRPAPQKHPHCRQRPGAGGALTRSQATRTRRQGREVWELKQPGGDTAQAAGEQAPSRRARLWGEGRSF